MADILPNSQLVDTDHQVALKITPEIIGRHKVVPLEQAKADFVILDTVPYLNEELPGLINMCEVILIPIFFALQKSLRQATQRFLVS